MEELQANTMGRRPLLFAKGNVHNAAPIAILIAMVKLCMVNHLQCLVHDMRKEDGV